MGDTMPYTPDGAERAHPVRKPIVDTQWRQPAKDGVQIGWDGS